ncbi:hypothetical protein J6590_023088 [Homalodisca vitripennis]|nr:hypothetical protein J6590_023088 [Homalodisca vitripennis]
MIKLYYQNECSLVKTLHALRPFYGRRGGPSMSTLQRLVAKFEKTGSTSKEQQIYRAAVCEVCKGTRGSLFLAVHKNSAFRKLQLGEVTRCCKIDTEVVKGIPA